MARGRFRTKGASNWAYVEYEFGWTAFPILEQVYRERAYEPRFDDLPWGATGEGLLATGQDRRNLAKTPVPTIHQS